MSGNNSSTSTVTNSSAPMSQAGINLNYGLGQANKLYTKGQLAPVAKMDPNTNAGLQGILAQARSGQGGLNAAFTSLSDIAGGKMLGREDPNYERIRGRALADASTEASMTASGMGRSGSDFHQSSVAQTVGDTAAAMDYGRYQDERANQMAAISALPGMFDATLAPSYAMTDVGSSYQGQAQQEANAPAANLAAYLQSLGVAAPYGTQTQTQTQTQPRNTLAQLLGGGLGLASLARG